MAGRSHNFGTVCVYGPFEDREFDVFGQLVNFGLSVGNLLCISGTCVAVSGAGVFGFDAHITLSPPAPLGSPNPFVGAGMNLLGSAVAGFVPGLSFVLDGTYVDHGEVLPATTLPGCTAVGFVRVTHGHGSMNAFRPETTAAGSNVQVQTTASFINPDTGASISTAIGVTYASVSVAGQTVVTATSNVAGQLASNLAVEVGGYKAVFIDVSTTASVTGPIEICGSYPDGDGDGFVDGTSVPETSLRLLHGEGNPLSFVDRTSRFDPEANFLCAEVSSLSPFVIAVDTTGQTSHDNVVSPISPVKVTIRDGKTEVVKTLRVKVSNGLPTDLSGHAVRLAILSSTCPFALLRNGQNLPVVPDFETKVAGQQDSATILGGKSRTALLPLTIRAVDFATPNAKSPLRCTLNLSARTIGEALPIDVNASNDSIPIQINVIDQNDY